MVSEKPDLVLFVGPVDLRQLKKVKFDRPTEIVMVHAPFDASSSYRNLGKKGILKVIQDATGKSADEYKKIAISAFSKGGSFTEEVLRDADTRKYYVDAVILNDAVFGSDHEGFQRFLVEEALPGSKLMVVTNSNNRASDTIATRARESVVEMVGDSGYLLNEVEPAGDMPEPSGGVWNKGKFFWYDYVKPTGVNDITHAAHHNLAANTWESHLVSFFRGIKLPIMLAAVGLLTMFGTIALLKRKS